ncbi:MAG: ubiquinone biosynthesis protein [Myxococcota bacterium]|jgi:ubiquinone biosynthesis protein
MAFKRHGAHVFRVYLQNLGATFIKMGQILSTRPDIIPDYLADELVCLQDQVPPVSFRKVRRVIEDEFGKPLESVFASFEVTPIASASVAQVHRATLFATDASPGNTVVAVKVRRPTVVRQAEFDETVMTFGAKVFSLIPTVEALAPVETVHEFCTAIREQLDFRTEADNNREFRKNFEGDAEIHFPALHEAMCGEAVLVMEFVDGVKDHNVEQLGLDRKRLARVGVRAILKMVYDDGFVHADLHPGNILFQPDYQVTFIDLGMVGRIDKQRRGALAGMVLALAQGDGKAVARFMYEGSARKVVKDYERYESDVVKLVDMTRQKSFMELELSLFIGSVFEILRKHRLRADAAFTTINIAMLVVEGLGKKLDPDLDLFVHIQPFLMQVVAEAPDLVRAIVSGNASRPAKDAGVMQ